MRGNPGGGGTWTLKQVVLPKAVYTCQEAGFWESEGAVKSKAGLGVYVPSGQSRQRIRYRSPRQKPKLSQLR